MTIMLLSRTSHGFAVQLFVAFCTWSSVASYSTIAPNVATDESVVISNLHVPSSEVFLWDTSPWGECHLARSDKCCEDRCVRRRQVSCIKAVERRISPDYYCLRLSHGEKPKSIQSCTNCTEDCVLSIWSPWSGCSASCGHATEFRSRHVVRVAVGNGDSCGKLSEFRTCKLDECPVPVYRWKIGPWTSCRKTSDDSAVTSSSQCGVGQRSRAISCINDKGHEVNQSLCLSASSGKTWPASTEFCDLPCDCVLSRWGDWSECSKTCQDGASVGMQTRVRQIMVLPEYGGLPCQSMIEKRHCHMALLPRCPSYRWHTEEWEDCVLLKDSEVCGAGQRRRQIYCVQENDEDMQPVEDTFCLQDMSRNGSHHKPPSNRACQVPCPRDCQLGQWGNWSPCSKSCGRDGHKVRSREVLVEMAHGGAECGPLTQTTKCEPVDCVWWHTGRWSRCFLDYGYSGCGPGSQVRVLYCKSSMDHVIDRSNCSHLEEPVRTKTCKVPCPSDCVVSQWSNWGACSRSCGKRGGVQTRTRQILAHADPQHSVCLPKDELTQSRVCNEAVWCRSYMWQVGPWTGCQRIEDGMCGEDMGTMTRSVTCEKDTGVPVEEHHCDEASRPDSMQLCNVSCPIDCALSAFSDWSACSQTCGEGYRYKIRRVVQLPAHGGTECPSNADKNGVITKRSKCKDLPACYTYHWQETSWSECTVLIEECGRGYQTRDVFCQRSDGMRDDPGVCLKNLLAARPPSYRSCHVPCAGDCILSEWSVFTSCSQTCGDTPGVMKRYRHIATTGPTNNLRQQCPHVTDDDLQEIVSCHTDPCPSYQWDVGQWMSCILHTADENPGVSVNDICGTGVQRRSVLCLRNDGHHVGREHCDSVSLMPDVHRPCVIECPEDCQVSKWSQWSNCSHVCGPGIKQRYRTTLMQSRNGGRICPPVVETSVCLENSCEIFEWQVSEWSVCVLQNNVSCGVGTQTRAVTCPAGHSHEDQCQRVRPKPETSRTCELPCPGDCVMSSWSEFSDCSEPCPIGGIKTRSREIIRLPSADGKQCGEEVDFVQCNREPCVPLIYTTELGEWTDCKPTSGDCGQGYKQRPVNCVRSDGVVVSPSNCKDFDVTLSIATCDVQCSEDCILSDYSDWSMCSHMCGMDGHKSRSRTVDNPSRQYGRPCQHELTQRTPCNVEPCYSYEWYRSEWSRCSIDSKGCGFGEKTRTVECRRSDGHTVDDVLCILQGEHYGNLTELQKITSSLNKTDLDLETTIPCGSVCPGDCQVSEWSDYSPCFITCDSDENGWKVRSRYITQRQSEGGKPCPESLLEVKPCPAPEAVCPRFEWQVGDWNNHDGTRDVWCQIERLNVNVTGGCVNELKPASNSECHPPCVDPFSECHDGQCQCQDGVMSSSGQCFPKSGCKSDHHCVFEHSHCDTTTDKCVCEDGYVLYNGIGPCLKINQDEDVTTDVVESLLDKDSSKMQVNKNGDLWKYVAIAIGGLLALVLVVIVAVILMMRRKRSNHGEVKATAKTVEFKHNNFDMNNYNNVNEKLSNIGKDTKPTKC